MATLLRDSGIGCLLQALGVSWLIKHPEESSSFELPGSWSEKQESVSPSIDAPPENRDNTSYRAAPSASEQPPGHQHASRFTEVTWYSGDDPENPHNWSVGKKTWVTLLLFAYTFIAYAGSSIYTPSIPGIVEEYGASPTLGSLGLALYVFGYGISPLLFSPLSEIPVIGRNPPYAVSFGLFAILAVPMALVDNMAGILVLRFILGFCASPAVTTVGASYGDFFDAKVLPYVILLWSGGATLAPTLAPLLSSYAVQNLGWRWSSWELLIGSAPIAIIMVLALPETSHDNILLRRARRLRKLTGRGDLRSRSEISQGKMRASEIVFYALIKPWQINALDPAVLFTTIYIALIYGTFYSFFESFPVVFQDIYGFDLGALGLAFCSLLAGLVIAVVGYCAYTYFIGAPRLARMESIPPEARMVPGLFACFLIPIGLFIFAWTARRSIHWIVCMIGTATNAAGVFIVVQSVLVYLPYTYPQYAGSLFAANGLARCLFGGAAVLFSPPMFDALGIAGGVSLLAGFSVLCVFGFFGIYLFGPSLRRRSKFAV